MTTIKTYILEAQKEFDRLNIHVSPEKCLADKEMVEKAKLLLPVAWELFKPDVKSFLLTKLTGLAELIAKEAEAGKRYIYVPVNLDKVPEKIGVGISNYNSALTTLASHIRESIK